MSHIEEVRGAIRKLHGAEATHRESVPVEEVFRGETVWDGIVEVFHLHGHPQTDMAYAWLHDTGEPGAPPQHVTVLHVHPALTSLDAVGAFIMQGYINAQGA